MPRLDILSNLRGDLQSTRIYKPTSDVPISDVQLHWDADRLLFSSLDSARKWQIYEMNIDGTGLHQKLKVPEPDLEFCDANYLPDGKIVATGNLGYNGVPCVHGDDVVAGLVSYDPATGKLRRLTFDQDGNWSPIVIPNGRIIVHPLGIYRPDTLFLPHRHAHEPRTGRKTRRSMAAARSSEQHFRHETDFEIQTAASSASSPGITGRRARAVSSSSTLPRAAKEEKGDDSRASV